VKCSFDPCDNTPETRGYCARHYSRLRRSGELKPLPRGVPEKTLECTFEGCDRRRKSRGLCKAHDAQRARGTELFPIGQRPTPSRSARMRGETYHGYLLVMAPPDSFSRRADGRVLEHRLVMEKRLGRALLPGENVHHKNGLKSDNRPENLELWVTLQPSGQRPDDLADWAEEILRRYRPSRLL
jgi:hypothetical protein